ncbi:MAG TPA: alpha,alpha-trehalase TreF [Vampirovibrionales bacterium]
MKTKSSNKKQSLIFVIFIFFCYLLFFTSLSGQSQQDVETPRKQLNQVQSNYGELFHQVQSSAIYKDSKQFPDMLPLKEPALIKEAYQKQKALADFNLKVFIEENFEQPKVSKHIQVKETVNIKEHVNSLWSLLSREGSSEINENSSLINLPHKYVVPGGRFNEIYYWDSYFTMLGLQASNKDELIRGMVKNFAYLIDNYGFIPNGNRTYFLSRSQPPFFALMVELLAEVEKNNSVYLEFLPSLEREYAFWMRGKQNLVNSQEDASERVVKLEEGVFLNRYWDELNTPRPEGYKEDLELAQHSDASSKELFRNIRAACESGWDFSSRWLEDKNELASIQTTNIIPIDLNSLLWKLESTIARIYYLKDNYKKAEEYNSYANARLKGIEKYLWNEKAEFFVDYDFIKETPRLNNLSLAAVYPLAFGIATKQQAFKVKEKLETDFLKEYGLMTTLNLTKEQWDGQKGWAPLQWLSIKGLQNYGYDLLAKKVATVWVKGNMVVFCKEHKMVEKYDVINAGGAEGGEYPLQDGFGWTNGVLLKISNEYLQLDYECK